MQLSLVALMSRREVLALQAAAHFVHCNALLSACSSIGSLDPVWCCFAGGECGLEAASEAVVAHVQWYLRWRVSCALALATALGALQPPGSSCTLLEKQLFDGQCTEHVNGLDMMVHKAQYAECPGYLQDIVRLLLWISHKCTWRI